MVSLTGHNAVTSRVHCTDTHVQTGAVASTDAPTYLTPGKLQPAMLTVLGAVV